MNSTQLLLLGLLVWFAMSNKSKDTRNVILVVTGILFFCMMNGKEGFTMDRSQLEVTFPTEGGSVDTPAIGGNVATYRVGDIIFEGDGPWDMSTIENIRCQDPNQTPTLPANRVADDPRVPSDISRFFTCEVPADVDCAGSWSACTEACESASERVWAQTAAQSGRGAACPPAPDCDKGEGDCPADMNKLDDDGTTKTCPPSGIGIHARRQRCLAGGLNLLSVLGDWKICKGWTHCDDDPSARPLENSDTAT